MKVGTATVVAVGALLLSDVGYRLAAGKYAQITASTPLPKGTLAKVPLQIGEWAGQDVALDPAIIKGTMTDDLISRTYSRGPDRVTLYVAYGVRIRDLAPHRPEVCYVGAGWVMDKRKDLELRPNDATILPVQMLTFTRGDFERQRTTVLNYYLVNGVYSSDVSGLRREALRLDRTATYSAQVEISCPALSPERAEVVLKSFTEEAAPLIRRLLIDAVHAAQSRPAGRE